jgi:hypothetical protein
MSIYLKISGGLGNQIFQYAAGRSLAKLYSCPLIIDTTWYKNIPAESTRRDILINQLNIKASFIDSNNDLKFLFDQHSFNWIQHIFHKKIFRERKLFTFDKSILRVIPPIYLDGYWQSEHYFINIHAELRSELFLSRSILSIYQRYLEMIKSVQDPVMVHLRRGDYITSSSASEIHGVLPISYYLNSIEYFKKKLQSPTFFIFSDDITWCRQYFSNDAKIILIDTEGVTPNPIDELYIMSMCDHFIIANSSLSWWGAWLNQSNRKIVVAPDPWMKKTKISTPDLIPKSWHKFNSF